MDSINSAQILQQNIVSNLRSGNIIIDTIVSMVLSGAYGSMQKLNLINSINKIILFIKTKMGYIKNETTSSIGFVVKINNRSRNSYHGNSDTIPIEYKAIIHKLDNCKINYRNIVLTNVEKPYWDVSDSADRCQKLNYVLNVGDIKITNNVYLAQTREIDFIADSASQAQYDKYNISIYSTTLTIDQLKAKLDKWVNTYTSYIINKKIVDLRYIIAEGHSITTTQTDSGVADITYKCYKLETHKNFNNIFFEDKEKLLKRIDTFQNGGDRYKRLGVPHNLGLLFYGEPGCGKTSCIKAMANKLQRHVIEVNLSKIKTAQQLRNVFYGEIINDMYIPVSKRIIVLEDIDCMDDIVNQRDIVENSCDSKDSKDSKDSTDSKDSKDSKDSTDSKDSKDSRDSKDNKDSKDSKDSNNDIANLVLTQIGKSFSKSMYREDSCDLTLSHLLNIIDGVLEQNQRITIMSTNNPGKLDSALIRTGRIDMKLHFAKCGSVECRQIVEYYYDTTYECEYPNGKYSPSDIIEICFGCETIESAVSTIMSDGNKIALCSKFRK